MRRRSILMLLILAVIALPIAGCGGSGSTGNGAASAKSAKSTTLRLGYYEDVQSPDPDVQYDIPGLEIVNNTYEGLVHYAYGNSTQIIPWLATSWKVSSADRVYTFQLRKGVLFHDGTPFNAAAAKASIERRIKINQGTFYHSTFVISRGGER